MTSHAGLHNSAVRRRVPLRFGLDSPALTLASELTLDLGHMLAGLFVSRARRQQTLSELRLLPKLCTRTIPEFLRAKAGKHATLARAVSEHAARRPLTPAIVGQGETLSFAELDRRVSGSAHALRQADIGSGVSIALVGCSTPAYLTTILAAARAGVAVSLVSPALRGELLRRALALVSPRLVIHDDELVDEVGEAGWPLLASSELLRRASDEQARPFEPAEVTPDADYVHIFTSGTTGFPKACRVTHERALLAASTFSELVFEFRAGDCLYSPLPLHHSSALLLGAGSALMAGVTLALRPRFSASEFWSDVRRVDASAMLYIGELCRALLAQEESAQERGHRVRVAVGNGLAPELWQRFRQRFEVEHVREFYAATDVPSAIVNVSDEPGSVGHVPLRRTRGFRLLRVDRRTLEVVRGQGGHACECAPGEPGELVVRVRSTASAPLGDVPVYTEPKASESRLIYDVFENGDCYYRSSDILVCDRDGYFRFVERAGESFRYKGENVSCAEVESVLRQAPQVADAAVVGLSLPGVDGTPPLGVVVPRTGFSAAALWDAVQVLPAYAQPCFVRACTELPLGETLKVLRSKLAADGVDPRSVAPLYVRTEQGYVELTAAIYDDIIAGRRRL